MGTFLKAYEEIVGPSVIKQLIQLAGHLEGKTVVHVNSTRTGGGVAEILDWLIPLLNELGLNASWEVIHGNPEFFNVTKAFHNGLQGKPVLLTQSMMEIYEKTVESNVPELREKLEEADYVFIHDPQPAALSQFIRKRKGKWIWRCHIDVSHPMNKVWKFVRNKVLDYDASVFSMPEFAQRLPHPQFIIAPSINPLSDKNCPLTKKEIHSVLERLNIPIDDRPLLTQVSRFDRFKDPLGVIQAFKLISRMTKARLVLAGGEATDDPEGRVVLDEVLAATKDEPDILVLLLPGDAHRTINALQRASTLIIQKSLQEGFGLTVTEALWKGKPVIGGNVGGIRIQVHSYYTGFLVNSPEGAALRIKELLHRKSLIKVMGENAYQLVKDNFLSTRFIREHLTLMLGLSTGLQDRLLEATMK